MAIIDLQRSIAQVGRIRIGKQVPTERGSRPTKLGTFRLTSPHKDLIETAARLYGGAVQPWEAPAGQQWEVETTTDRLRVLVPPTDMAFDVNYELWSRGGCQRRCNGHQELISDGPCLCDADQRQCSIHARLSLLLRDVPGFGIWRLDTSGYYAATELQGAVDFIRLAADRGTIIPATLRLEQRVITRPDTGTRRFAVPVLHPDMSLDQLARGATLRLDAAPDLTAMALDMPQDAPAEVRLEPLPDHSDGAPEIQPAAPPDTRPAAQQTPRQRRRAAKRQASSAGLTPDKSGERTGGNDMPPPALRCPTCNATPGDGTTCPDSWHGPDAITAAPPPVIAGTGEYASHNAQGSAAPLTPVPPTPAPSIAAQLAAATTTTPARRGTAAPITTNRARPPAGVSAPDVKHFSKPPGPWRPGQPLRPHMLDPEDRPPTPPDPNDPRTPGPNQMGFDIDTSNTVSAIRAYETTEAVALIDDRQHRQLMALLNAAGFTDTDTQLGFLSAATNTEITDPTSLTAEQASNVIEILDTDARNGQT